MEDHTEENFDDVSDITVLGDSLVRDLGKVMPRSKKTKSCVFTYPGAKIRNVKNRVNDFVEPEKNSFMVVNVGSNDVFQKHVASQDIVERYKELIGTLKDRRTNIVIIGILPRLHENNFNLSRAIGINDKLSHLCREAKISFIHPWLDFISNKQYYKKDSTHLRYNGTQHLASLIIKQIHHHKQAFC